MESAKRIFTYPLRWLWLGRKYHEPTPEEKLQLKLMPYQRYLYKFQELVLWNKPYESLTFIALVNAFFLFLGCTNLRFYCVACWSALVFVLHEAWIYRIWPVIRAEKPSEDTSQDNQQNPPEGMLSVPELSKFVTCLHSFATHTFVYLRSLRTSHPSAFCMVMSSVLLVLIQIGSAVSGFWLLYLVTMSAILAPGIVFRLMSPQMRTNLASVFTRLALFIQPKESNDRVVEEFLPEESKENLTLFNLACGDNGDKTNVSTPSSDMDVLPLEPIPSFDESSLDRDFSLELEPTASSRAVASSLSFAPTHFNGSTLSAALKRALADTLGPNLVTTAVEESSRHSDLEHSDSSDFELIDPEEDDPKPT